MQDFEKKSTRPVYFGENLTAWNKNILVPDVCEECPMLIEKAGYSLVTGILSGYYTCRCNLDTDSRSCIYDVEEGIYDE